MLHLVFIILSGVYTAFVFFFLYSFHRVKPSIVLIFNDTNLIILGDKIQNL